MIGCYRNKVEKDATEAELIEIPTNIASSISCKKTCKKQILLGCAQSS